MKIYFAPMEGIAGYIYRNAYNEYFKGIDKYFAPFITTSPNGIKRMKEFRDILPKNNAVPYLVPQLLSNNVEDFLRASDEIGELGYEEINLNLGCPSGTVTSKKRGAGLLTDRDMLERFLEGIYAQCTMKISVKTRIGYANKEEFRELIEIFNKFPIYELIIHPRTREDYYRNDVKLDSFQYAIDNSKHVLCYNGNIFDKNDYCSIIKRFERVHAVMLGRGILRNPSVTDAIISKDVTEDKPDWNKIFAFHDKLYSDYREYLSGDTNLLFKMKEIWLYMISSVETSGGDTAKWTKKIKKIKNLYEYHSVISELRTQFLS